MKYGELGWYTMIHDRWSTINDRWWWWWWWCWWLWRWWRWWWRWWWTTIEGQTMIHANGDRWWEKNNWWSIMIASTHWTCGRPSGGKTDNCTLDFQKVTSALVKISGVKIIQSYLPEQQSVCQFQGIQGHTCQTHAVIIAAHSGLRHGWIWDLIISWDTFHRVEPSSWKRKKNGTLFGDEET